MRKVIGYTETGAKVWRDEGPSSAHLPGHRGSLVVGERAPVTNHPLTDNQKRPDDRAIKTGRPRMSPDIELHPRGKVYATDEERIAARRQSWRESAHRKRARLAAERAA